MKLAASQPISGKEAPHSTTKGKILDTAERLFASRGVGGVSIREITQAAGVNLASINYYFGGKQHLVAAVFSRRLLPMNQRRLAMLEEAEQLAGDKPVKVEAVLEALIYPAVEQGFADGRNNNTFLQLIGRCLSEPDEETEMLIRKHTNELIPRFDKAFRLAAPGLSREELDWRIRFVVGALHFSLLACGNQNTWPVKLEKKLDAKGLTQRLVSFAAAGLKAALPES